VTFPSVNIRNVGAKVLLLRSSILLVEAAMSFGSMMTSYLAFCPSKT
jgi:hypothetical protein